MGFRELPPLRYEPVELTGSSPTTTAKINQQTLIPAQSHIKGCPRKIRGSFGLASFLPHSTMTDDLRGVGVENGAERRGVGTRIRGLGCQYVLIPMPLVGRD